MNNQKINNVPTLKSDTAVKKNISVKIENKIISQVNLFIKILASLKTSPAQLMLILFTELLIITLSTKHNGSVNALVTKDTYPLDPKRLFMVILL